MGSNHTTSSVNTQLSHPYISQEFINEKLIALRPESLSETREFHLRAIACAWIDTVGKDLQFPVRTIGTAMMIYHKFHLINPISEFNSNDVCSASLFVAAKMEDTSKRARDILVVGHALRNPQSPDIDPDSVLLEDQRKRIMGLERMILESRAFDFRHRHPQPFLIKFARVLQLDHERTRLAWSVSLDSYRSLLPLQIPPHAIALACLILACKATSQSVSMEGDRFGVDEGHLQIALEALLDFYLHVKGITTDADICNDEALLMEIKSELMSTRSRQSMYKVVSRTGKDGASNLSAMGDRGTCRYVLDPDRMDM